MYVSQLRSRLESIDSQINKLNKKLEQIARENFAGAGMPQSYYSTKSKIVRLQEQQRDILQEIGTRSNTSAKNSSVKTFVNGFGEATNRNITSQSYNNSQKRLSKEVMRMLGN